MGNATGLGNIQNHDNFDHEDYGGEFRTSPKDEILLASVNIDSGNQSHAGGNIEHRYTPSQVDSRAKEADAMKLKGWPNVPQFKQWWRDPCELVASSSRNPKFAYKWITAVERFNNYEDITLDETHAALDSKILAGLSSILQGEFSKNIHVMKDKIATDGDMMQGRQLAWLIRV